MINSKEFEVNDFHFEPANREKILKDIAEVFSDFFEMTIDMIETVKKDSLKNEMLVSACLAKYQMIRIENKSDFSEEEIRNYGKMLEFYSRCSEVMEVVIEKMKNE